jgi:DNA-binding transcriptional LysR family regulator
MLLQHLITFSRVVEEGSFTRAAQLLNLTQPSVTKQIAALEDHLGAELFSRQGKQVHVTPAGEIVYEYARQVTHLVRQCEGAVAELKSPGAGHIRVGCVGLIGLVTLPDLLADFAAQYPLARFSVKTGNNQETAAMLLHGEVDLALVTTPIMDDRLEVRRLFDDPLVLVLSPGNRLGIQPHLTLSDLAHVPMVTYRKGTRFRAFVDQALGQMGVSPNVTMEFDNHEAVVKMARLGFGVAISPISAVREDLNEGRLVQVSVENMPSIGRTTSLILRRGERRLRLIERFIAFLEERLKRLPD